MIEPKAPMPWIGLYAAVASLIWNVVLMADLVHSVRHRKSWFPCRYSALNAASLTVLAVAVKLSMDLTTKMPGAYDQAAKSTSTAFLCASTTHFMPSLGSMSNRDMLVNLTALGILVVTLTVNVIIQVLTGVIEFVFQLVVVFMNVYAFIILSSSALTVSSSKRYLERKYNELHKRISAEELQGDKIMDFDKLKLRVKKYWVMARTGNPQFVMVRSDACGALFLICFISYISPFFGYNSGNASDYGYSSGNASDYGYSSGNASDYGYSLENASDYGESVRLVYWTQYVGMIICVIMSLGRFLEALLHTARNIRKYTISSISLEIKNYRMKRLVEWKKGLPPLQVRSQKLRRIIFEIRNLLFNICIGSQVVIVIVNKLLTPISILGILYLLVTSPLGSLILILIPLTFLVFFYILRMGVIRWLVMLKNFFLRKSEASVNPNESDLRNFVLLLEGEGIQNGYLMFVNTSINSSIMKGAKNQPRYLMKLMENSTSFEGVLKYESDQVSSIICEEPPNTWSLSVATLTSISVALPNVQNEKRNQLLRSIIEGFKYVRLIEKNLDVQKKLVTSTSAADFVWVTVEMRHKWLDMDLDKIARKSKSSKETLQNLANKSEEILNAFTSEMNGNATESSIHLPETVIIANSMYKISNSLLLVYEESYLSASDNQVFERLSVIIADLFAACLTNLPYVILKKCNNCAIEKREKSTREAAHLLGETQDILKALQEREIPNISPDQSIYIEEWRTLLKHNNHGISDPMSSSENSITAPSGDVHLDIQELRASGMTVLETDKGNAESHVSEEEGTNPKNIITAPSGDVHLDIQELRASAMTALETNEGNAESHVSGEEGTNPTNIITAPSGDVHFDIQELHASAMTALETDEGNALCVVSCEQGSGRIKR